MTVENQKLNPAIYSSHERVVFFPVRHHSPACARFVQALAEEIRPAAILIEGPSDFNARLGEMSLPHQLPIAIYSYTQTAEGARRGAFYPFCLYSPEWQALQIARELAIPASFIDLPWHQLLAIDAAEPPLAQRYADGELRQSEYVEILCKKLGVEDFDLIWDTLFEIDDRLSLEEYLKRAHHFCHMVRYSGGRVSGEDLRREEFMAARINQVRAEVTGQVLVVTGGFHSYALFKRLESGNFSETALPEPIEGLERGIALTPYSYQRLDSLTGYEAGMPHPGFYHQLWLDNLSGKTDTHRTLLGQVVESLRAKKQVASAADLIAVETMAQGLSALRSHRRVWRNDLLDGITAALVKEELEKGVRHPFLEAVYLALRGEARGQLAEGTALPPLVYDLRLQLKNFGLEPQPGEQLITLDLSKPAELEASRLLHRVTGLGIQGFILASGTDFYSRHDLSKLWESWRLKWSPEFEASCIEAALYGQTLAEASTAKLLEKAGKLERDAERAALLLLEAGLMGLGHLVGTLFREFLRLIREDSNFFKVARALEHLLYLFRYDEALGTAGSADLGALVVETFERGLWLLEGLGQATGQDKAVTEGVKVLLEAFERGRGLTLDRVHFTGVLRRVSNDRGQTPAGRGATTGALWVLGEAALEEVTENLRYFSDPVHLGDFLTGLFFVAREVVQRQPELVRSIDLLVMGYDDEEFLEALPSLRLAFSFFAPREKHYMTNTLLSSLGLQVAPLPQLEVSPEVAARVLAFETKLFQAIEYFGLGGGVKE